MDLHERVKGKLVDSFGPSLVNIYIPTEIYAQIHGIMVYASEFVRFAGSNVRPLR